MIWSAEIAVVVSPTTEASDADVALPGQAWPPPLTR